MEPLKIVLMGHVNAGKSTLVSALIPGPYCQISPQRCTNATYSFRIQHPDECGTLHESSEATRKQIEETNEAEVVSDSLNHLSFSVPSSSPLGGDIEIIDLPGWQSGSSQLAEKQNTLLSQFICEKWNTFGVVVFVVDLIGAATNGFEAEVKKLEELKKFNKGVNLDIVVVFNKVDDQDEDGIWQLIETTSKQFKDIFIGESQTPLVLVISAKKALYYRFVSNLKYDQFKRIYKQTIGKIGRTVLGEWPLSRFQPADQDRSTSELFNFLTREHDRVMSPEGSNFGSLLDELSKAVQGQNAVTIQQRILEHKLKSIELADLQSMQRIQEIVSALRALNVLRDEMVEEHCQSSLYRGLKKALCHLKETGDFVVLSEFIDFVETVRKVLEVSKSHCTTTVVSVYVSFFDLLIQQFESFKRRKSWTRGTVSSSNKRKRPSIYDRKVDSCNSSEPVQLHLQSKCLFLGDWWKIWKAQLEVPELVMYFPRQYHFVTNLMANFDTELGLSNETVSQFEEAESKGRNGDMFEPINLSLYDQYNTFPISAYIASPSAHGHFGQIAWKCVDFLSRYKNSN